VLTRIAASHIRVGTFEYASAVGGRELLDQLIAYTLARHFPEEEQLARPALTLLHGVLRRQARLIAQWMGVGFVHGVMNTDNMALSGETIDYGPCAFLDYYDPSAVFSSIDHHGRYAYDQQPGIALWNLTRLAESLLPCWEEEKETAVRELEEILGQFETLHQRERLAVWRTKLGLVSEEAEDAALIEDFLENLRKTAGDFTRTCRGLADWLTEDATIPPAWRSWHERWTERLRREDAPPSALPTRLRAANPARIPRNHAVQDALDAASTKGDLGPFIRLWHGLRNPFEESTDWPELNSPPPPDSPRFVTFCGT
jgi:uncharacterized protein YdiU (UPF0061 family)